MPEGSNSRPWTCMPFFWHMIRKMSRPAQHIYSSCGYTKTSSSNLHLALKSHQKATKILQKQLIEGMCSELGMGFLKLAASFACSLGHLVLGKAGILLDEAQEHAAMWDKHPPILWASCLTGQWKMMLPVRMMMGTAL